MDMHGFTFTKITGFRNRFFEFPFKTNTNVQFDEISKEKTDALKDKDLFSVQFTSSVGYIHEVDNKNQKDKEKEKVNQAEVSLSGFLSISLDKEESKELQKQWKKKEIPENMREPLFNIILRKTIIRALAIEDELNIPPHLSLPKVKFQQPPQ